MTTCNEVMASEPYLARNHNLLITRLFIDTGRSVNSARTAKYI